MEYQKCPICNGVGRVSGGFYTRAGDSNTWVGSSATEICRQCNGTGLIIKPSESPTYMEELREKIFDAVTDPPCRNCEFWDVQGHYCYLKDLHPNTKKCRLLDQILAIIKQAGYVKLADDQSLPCITHRYGSEFGSGYAEAQEDMLKSGFRRMEL